MIRLYGPPASAGYHHAGQWRARIAAAWPDISEQSGDDIRLLAGVTVGDDPAQHFDLILAGRLVPPRRLSHELAAELPPAAEAGRLPAYISSFCAFLTVAPADPEQVRWHGDHVGVRDPDTGAWTDLLDANRNQQIGLRAALERQWATLGNGVPRRIGIVPLIWLAGITEEAMIERYPPDWLHDPAAARSDPNSPLLRRNVLYADATWEEVLSKLGRHWPEQHDFLQTRTLHAVPPPQEAALLEVVTNLAAGSGE